MAVHADAVAALIEGYVVEQVAEAEGDRAGLEASLAEAEADATRLGGEVQRLTGLLATATDNVTTLRELLTTTQTQRDGALAEAARLTGLLEASALKVGALTAELDQAKARIAQLETTPAQPIGDTMPEPKPKPLFTEDFPGATFDDRLDAAFAHAAAQTVTPAVQILDTVYEARRVQPMTSRKKLIGGPAVATQQRAAKSHSNLVKVAMPDGGAWFRMPDVAGAEVWDFELSRISFIGNSGTDLISGGRGVLWSSNIDNIAAVNFRHILGSPAAKLLLTACDFGGEWNINNSRARAVTIGGSDNELWMTGRALFDSPTTLSGTTDAHVCLDYMSKSNVGGLYVTAEGGPAALLINGGTSSFGMNYWGLILEGRNAGAPSKGSVLRVNGGTNVFHGLTANYAGTDFAGTPRKYEQGVISAFGGTNTFRDTQYARATGVAETVPLLYANGTSTKVKLENAMGVGGGWVGKPGLRLENGAKLIDDDSYVLV